MGRHSLGIVVPARNEEKTIKNVLTSLKNYGDVLVVDDFSTDKTLFLTKNLKIKYIKNKKKLGYEATTLKGIKYLLKKKYKYIATFDADGEHDPKFLININKLQNFDLLIGERKKLNRFSEYFFSYTVNFFFNIRDPLSGLKVYRSKILNQIDLNYENDYNTNLIFKIRGINGKIIHKPLNVKKRKDTSRLGNALKVNLNIIICLFRLLFKIITYKLLTIKKINKC